MIEIVHEEMNDCFEKFHVKGLPFNTAYHHFKKVDSFELAHDHPWDFQTTVITGSYVEEIYHVREDGTWYRHLRTLVAGETYLIKATHIHRIIALPSSDCWTMCVWGETKRDVRFWDFSSNIAKSKLWNE